MVWGIRCCETCAGTGLAYCQHHERACDHDRLCPKCRGRGHRSVKLDAIEAAASSETYRTRGEAWAVLMEEFEYV